MNKPDPTEVLNKNISYLVDIMKLEIDEIGQKHDFTPSQISEMEKDFIARLAFSAIKYGVNKEEEEDCESCPAKDHCLFKEPEKPDKKTVPDEVWKALSFTHNYCKEHDDCDGCMFSEHYQCKIKYTPNEWKV